MRSSGSSVRAIPASAIAVSVVRWWRATSSTHWASSAAVSVPPAGGRGGSSGFRQVFIPGPNCTGVIPSARASAAYSPFWSAGTRNRRPNAAARTAHMLLTRADLPEPTVPATKMLGLVMTPSA